MRKNSFSIALFFIVFLCSNLFAQSSSISVVAQRWYYTTPGFYSYSPWYGYSGYGYGGYGGSTLYGDYVRGLSDLYRARGAYLQSYTKAMINYQEARKKYIENQEKLTELYWINRREQSARRKAKKDERARRRRELAARRSKVVRIPPRRVTPSELDPVSGKIFWPSELKKDSFTEYRQKLEELFVLRAHTRTMPGLPAEIYHTARDMKDKLKLQIQKIPVQRYLVARKFLDLLALEGRLPPL